MNQKANTKYKDAPGRIPPQAIEVEEAVLGAIMLEKEAFPKVAGKLCKDAFYENKHQLIYDAMCKLDAQDKPIDILTVNEQLKADGTLEKAGGVYELSELVGKVGSASHIEYHTDIVVNKFEKRRIINLCGEVLNDAFDETTANDEIKQKLESGVFALSQSASDNNITPIAELVQQALKKIEDAANSESGLTGITSGFNDIDNITYGWQPTDLIIAAARPAMGKTAFALSMLKNIAIDNNIPAMIFSLEMSKLQLVNRFVQNVCGITGDKVKSGRLEDSEWFTLTSKSPAISNAPIYIDDTPSISIQSLRSKARKYVANNGVKIIFIDYLQLMKGDGKINTSREQEVATISRSLKGLAKELNVPIIALSQLNRSVETRTDKRPNLSDLRESGAIEQDADVVCFIHRPEYYKIFEDDKGNDLRGISEIIFAKNRSGRVDDVRLKFKGEYTTFENLNDGISYSSTYKQESQSRMKSIEEEEVPF